MTNVLEQPNRPERGSQSDGRRIDNFVAHPLTALDTADLKDLIVSLSRFVQDLHSRKERRAAMLNTPPDAPQSDPLYQRLFYAHDGFCRQIESVRRELSRRAVT